MMKSVRRLLSYFAVTVLLLLAVCPAMAETQALEISVEDAMTLSPGQSAKLLTTKVNSATGKEITYSLTDTERKTVIYTKTQKGVSAGKSFTWSVPYDDTGLSASHPVKEMRASFVMGGKTYTCLLYYTYSAKDKTITVEKPTWYYKNTACSFGPAFRDVKPSLTDKWYTFTPVDLTIQGRQTFEYIASNLYIIGEVYVDVYGDDVTVTYYNFYDRFDGNTKTLSEYCAIYHNLKSVKDVNPETTAEKGYAFGQHISIQNDLEGDTNVLLYIRNQVTYCTYPIATKKLTRYWPNLPERKDLREKMIEMMD